MVGTHGEQESRRRRPPESSGTTLGAMLRQAWIGYRRRIDEGMRAAGFGDGGFPDGRVLRICSTSPDPTISEIGRQLGITRQGSAKVVASLRDRGYVSLEASRADRREKIVRLTERAEQYLAAHRRLARAIEREIAQTLGPAGMDALGALLGMLGGSDQPRLRGYLRSHSSWWGE